MTPEQEGYLDDIIEAIGEKKIESKVFKQGFKTDGTLKAAKIQNVELKW